jgi:hypothetical protein
VDVYSESNYWGSNAFYGSAIQGFDRSLNPSLDALVLGNAGTPRLIDANLLQVAFDRINIETGEEPDIIWGHHDVLRALFDSLASDRRYVTGGSQMSMDAGFSKLSYDGVPLVKDRQAPYNSLLVGKKSALKIYTLMDLAWQDKDGSILSRISNTDAYEAFMCTYKNLGLDENPKKLCMIRDIQTDL